MKLLSLLTDDDAQAHLLPDAPQNRPPWAIRLSRRLLSRLFSTKGLTICIGVLLVVLLTAIIGSPYLAIPDGLDHHGISRQNFYAPRRIEVVDQEATQRKIDRARKSVSPVYQDEAIHNKDVTETLDRLLADMTSVATDEDQTDRHARFMQLVSTTPHAEEIFQRYFRQSISASEWMRISSASHRGLQAILKRGYTEADDQLHRDSVIRENIPAYGFGRQYRGLVYFLLDSCLEPNLILDEKAMERRRADEAARVTPEIKVYEKDQKIVGQGEVASPVQLEALSQMGKATGGFNWVVCLGVFLLSMLFVFTVWSYLWHFRERDFFRPSYASLIAFLTVLSVGFLQSLGFLRMQGFFGDAIPIYVFPLAAYALTLAIFMHNRIAIMATTLLVFLVGLTMRVDFAHLSVLLFGSFMGLYILNKRINFSERMQLMYAGLYVGATNALILMAVSLLDLGRSSLPFFGPDQQLFAMTVLVLVGFVSGAISGIITIGTLPLLEAVFRLVTPYTLMELGNHDKPLLKRMQFEAPGTFHHSLMVATLSEAAAEAIGANPLLTRVGCLYHDIGKMKRPLFFIENQAYFGVENPHDKLTPRLSKMVITAHPRDSLEMARQYGLPECLMAFMTEHHGTLTAGYFYNKALQEEGAENVNKSQFRYPGPKPGSRETAIVMLADACESAVRALKSPTVAQVEERIDKIIQQRIEDGQFDNCPITFKDIEIIKQTFVRILRGIQHNRIEYQQNMMRELGRKLPTTAVPDQAGLQEALRVAQQVKPEAGETETAKAKEKDA